MYGTTDLDLWRRRREELERDAEDGRLARRLRKERPKASRWGGILGRVLARGPRKKGAA